MASPVAPSTNPVAPVKSLATGPDAAASGELAGFDFAAMLQTQVDQLEATDTTEAEILADADTPVVTGAAAGDAAPTDAALPAGNTDAASVPGNAIPLTVAIASEPVADSPAPASAAARIAAAPASAPADTASPAAPAGRGATGVLQGLETQRAMADAGSEKADPAPAAKFAEQTASAAGEKAGATPADTSRIAAAGVAHGLPATGQPPGTANAGTTTPVVHLATPFGDARWAGDVGQKIVWLARQDMADAQISINPPRLGQIDINLNLAGDKATAVFSSPHADVREALESALPRLREMLAAAGISLGQADVRSQSGHHGGAGHANAGGNGLSRAERSILGAETDVNLAQAWRGRAGVGLVDTFA